MLLKQEQSTLSLVESELVADEEEKGGWDKEAMSSDAPSLEECLPAVYHVEEQQESHISDYFGSVGETGSWFNVNEREQRVPFFERELFACDLQAN